MTIDAKSENRRAGSRAIGVQGERTRARLLEAAKVVLRERGYPATRIDDIARAAGTSHGAFYLYFANKHEILEALARQTSEVMLDLTRRFEGIEPGERGYEQLRAWVSDFIDLYRENAPVLQAWVQAEPEDSRFDRLGRKILGSIAGQIAHVIHGAVEAGTRHPVSPPVAATALVGMLERFCFFWLVRGAPFKHEDVVDTLATVWYETIFGQRLVTEG
jgi:AcrR family transcriptional regulator